MKIKKKTLSNVSPVCFLASDHGNTRRTDKKEASQIYLQCEAAARSTPEAYERYGEGVDVATTKQCSKFVSANICQPQ
ncbi:MAG: hypothetical protein A2845_03965 [Candidatus Lloydbacteria bacterium RIFCSPHIGHO2_01_FULL_49_22]|uniref:Uncharacterized protein n=1 Tax=Candidatus Lloydbacteria bacterium RIFCSPHIGHO2_01_FULL_49_22 TaxID=1798658 RepID=A0A1G2CZ26_9BACT|nr:MAG: hypothetical protein A2845_03965 [Candidatus Lloydbacteria bacterium RIFCSPHIGHO2_01_FULL_49_22]OGZ09083.1 MAG: hypothetical protein A3C14_03800 [Candidatus Lloydbacteria bacterium RIFCSPHIGHO2_02_FULL_50_18]